MRLVVSLGAQKLGSVCVTSLQNQVVILLQKINGCVLKYFDASRTQVFIYCRNVYQLVLVDLQRIVAGDSDLFQVFVEEYRKLFRRQNIHKIYIQFSAEVF